jgi:hypothetical protein
MKIGIMGFVIGLCGCAAQSSVDALGQAVRDMPPMVYGARVTPANGQPPYALSCPAAGARVERRAQPAIVYLGADAANPDLCHMRIGDTDVRAWFAIWHTDWPGAAEAYPAMLKVIHGATGEVAASDTYYAPGWSWHEVFRNEGLEALQIRGTTYSTIKLSHYREGSNGNIYRSLITLWKDIPTGMILFSTYEHIAGAPVVEAPVIPTAIIPPPG